MRGLVYSSTANNAFTLADLGALAANSAQRNAQVGISGYLYYDKGRFMQYLEGEAEAIAALMARIERDERHTIRRVVVDDTLCTQRFPTWHMQWLQQGSMVAIRLEHILYEFMNLKTAPNTSFELLTPKVWELVDKIAATQVRFN